MVAVGRAGETHVLFDDAIVRRSLQAGGTWRDLRELLLDMTATVIQLDARDALAGTWGEAWTVASYVGDANRGAKRPVGQFGAPLRRLVLSPGFSRLIRERASISITAPVFARIVALRHPVSRAVARWCLSHSGAQHQRTAAVLAAVGAVVEGEAVAGRGARRMAWRYVGQLQDDAEGLAALGVTLSAARVHYERQPGVFIQRGTPKAGCSAAIDAA